MSDTAATIRLRWEEKIVRVCEAEVAVDQLPDSMIEEGEDGTWSLITGAVEHVETSDFLEGLDIEGRAIECSLTAETRIVLDSEPIAPIMVAAAPVPALGVTVAEDDYLGDLADRAEWRAELREGTPDE